KKLGTRFDYYFFESQVFEDGLKLVEEGKEKGVFEESDGAVVYRGEQDGLHTRVFVNARGLPTYETKELGLTKQKFETEAFDQSVVVTANEQTSYFQVVLAALGKLRPEWREKTKHIEHGMLQAPDGKMSSRKGNVIGGGTLIEDVEERAREKIAESERELEDPEKLATEEAVAAIKYAILRQTPGKNVVFDIDQSLSLEGDSGPYLQYTHTRCVSVLEKAEREGVTPSIETAPAESYELERVLYRFPEVVERAFADLSPQALVTYVTELASMFNTFYGTEQIVSADDEYSPYKCALTRATRTVLANGLHILGIDAPERM
ncbi:MAG: arginine--tRNA ligase, partial [Candidatus Paceibacterota bacterium]